MKGSSFISKRGRIVLGWRQQQQQQQRWIIAGRQSRNTDPSSRRRFLCTQHLLLQQQQQHQNSSLSPLLLWRIIPSQSRSFSSKSSSRLHSSLSSSSAALQEEEDSDEEDDDDEIPLIAASSSSSSSELRMPRLEALRRRLSDESSSNNGVVSLMDSPSSSSSNLGNVQVEHHGSSINSQKSRTISKSSSPLQPLTKSIDLDSIDVIDLIRQLEEMDAAESSDAPLTDTYGRTHDYLRLSLTERCNLRCTYCMPEAGVPLQPAEHLLQTPELLQLASHFFAQGVSKFRLTGGEPTLRKDLVDIVAGLNQLYQNDSDRNRKPQIGMTTNGVVLAKQLPDLVEAGLTSVNVSLDSLDADKFAQLSRRPAAYLERVLDAIEMLTTQEPYKSQISTKINCVVQRNVNDDELVDFVEHFCQNASPESNLQAIRFIEYMPFTENGWDLQKLVPHAEMMERIQASQTPLTQLVPTDPHDTTKWYTTATASSHEDAANPTKIGFITSMSNHFCAGCNRLRMSPDGQLQVCLFGTNGRSGRVSLRDALRAGASPQQLNLLIKYALSRKHYKLGGHDSPDDIRQQAGTNNRPMTLIGG